MKRPEIAIDGSSGALSGPITPDDRLIESVRWMWSLGDYTELARWLEPAAVELADTCDIRPGMQVLDVAAGNGNFAITAAKRGAMVVASDLAPHMIRLGRQRSSDEQLEIEWVEANAEELPFQDGRFDLTASVFGAMFAFHPEQVGRELFRVTKPGGLVAMANYSSRGFLGGMGKLLDSLRPARGATPPSPFLWGDPETLRERFGQYAESIETRMRTGAFEFSSLEEAWAFWERTNPPQSALRTMLPPDAYAAIVQRARVVMSEQNQARDGRVRLEWDWLLVLARRAS